ncbi:uncharacterized protein EI97DRAFT_459605 [Westerdykella ornata]|uniref:Uncharacterized protein n=1 Tax=Westerdykella ornata TaxID=318751 RepID=A0A6A6JEC1_WESOR|nr:uncharacterized protein EI97DRAFT_459605 [Westerdykella ornata]KAF2274960.1 hypothetical protein EI97DRAFT_459605 [Westerdykella ornata]
MKPVEAALYVLHTYNLLWKMSLPNGVALTAVTFMMMAPRKFQAQDHPSAVSMSLIIGVLNYYFSFIQVAHTPYRAYAIALLVTLGSSFSQIPDLTPFRAAFRNMTSIWPTTTSSVPYGDERKCGITIRRTKSASSSNDGTKPVVKEGITPQSFIVQGALPEFWRLTAIQEEQHSKDQTTEYIAFPMIMDWDHSHLIATLIDPGDLRESPSKGWSTTFKDPGSPVSEMSTTIELAPTRAVEQGPGDSTTNLATLHPRACAATMRGVAGVIGRAVNEYPLVRIG